MNRFVITAATTIGEILAEIDAGTDLYYDDNGEVMKLVGALEGSVLTVYLETDEVE